MTLVRSAIGMPSFRPVIDGESAIDMLQGCCAFAAQTAIDKTNKISANFLGIGFC